MMPNADDAQLQQKARRRLIGAVVFVSFAALVLLLAMDIRPSDTPAPSLIIPSPDGTSVEVYPLTLPPISHTPEPAATAAPPARPAPAPRPAPKSAATAPAPKPAPKPTAAAPKPAPATTASTPAKPAANTAVDTKDANRAAAILAGRLPDTNQGASQPAVNAAAYVVQVFASNNATTVQETVEKLRALKLPVYTESASGDMTRVRVGPYPTRSEAEVAEGKINQEGKISGTRIFPQQAASASH